MAISIKDIISGMTTRTIGFKHTANDAKMEIKYRILTDLIDAMTFGFTIEMMYPARYKANPTKTHAGLVRAIRKQARARLIQICATIFRTRMSLVLISYSPFVPLYLLTVTNPVTSSTARWNKRIGISDILNDP